MPTRGPDDRYRKWPPPRKAFGGVDVGLSDAFSQSTFLGGFHFVGVAPHDELRVDDLSSLKHFESQFFQAVDDDGRSTKFSPPGFRVAVKRAAERHHFIGVASNIKHGVTPQKMDTSIIES